MGAATGSGARASAPSHRLLFLSCSADLGYIGVDGIGIGIGIVPFKRLGGRELKTGSGNSTRTSARSVPPSSTPWQR
jgi:hypothetical protein